MRDNDGVLLVVAVAVVLYILRKNNRQTNGTTSISPGTGTRLAYPVVGRVSSEFGTRVHPVTGVTSIHNGIDLAVSLNTVVKAPADGVVQSQYSNSVGGVQMIIRHDNGLTTGYAHLNSYLVSMDQRVQLGQAVAKSGSTGNSTGPHLHFTVRDSSGNLQNPRKYLP